MKIRTVTSLREFDELADLWRELTETSGQHSPLVSHDWFACCWRTAGRNHVREAWVFEDGARPAAAIIPLVRTRGRYRGFPARVVQLMHPPDTPMTSFPVAGDVCEVMKSFLAELQRRDDWDVLLMPRVPAKSTVWKALEAELGDRRPWRVADREQARAVALTDRDPGFRAVVERLQREVGRPAATRRHSVTIEDHPDPDPRGPLFDELMGVVRSESRGAAGLPRPTADEVRRFFRELAGRPATKGCLNLWVLRLDGRVVEAEYQIASGNAVRALRRDSDQAPTALRLGDTLTLAILKNLARRQTAQTYYQIPNAVNEDARTGSSAHDMVSIEVFTGSYGVFLHRLETRVMSFARRLTGSTRACG